VLRRFQPHPFQFLVVFAIAAALFSPSMHGQAPTPSPVAGTQPGASSSITTLHTYSNLVVIDVVVDDAKGNPIHGLKASDFDLTENNKPQAIRNFQEHTSAETNKVIRVPKLPAGMFSNRSPSPASGPVNVLLLDYLNTPLSAQPYARKQLIDYLDKAPPGTRIAIFGLTTRLFMLQGFTSDPELLKAALSLKKGGAPQASQILSDVTNGGTQGDTTLSDALAGPTEAALAGGLNADMIADAMRFEAFQSSFELDLRAKYTLGGFEQLARYLMGIPGRKNVIWYSASFPLDVEPNPALADPQDSVVRNDDEVRRTDNLLTRAQVAVYPVDARGLMTDQSQSVVNNTALGGADAANATMTFLQQTSQEHETMYSMAEDTGGEAFVNTNDLTHAVAKAINDGSNYYTLTYTPTNKEWDQRFRAIKIKLQDQPKAQLSYRNGYYADDPNDRSKWVSQAAATAVSAPTTMATALIHGGPDPAEILFKIRVRPAATPPEDAVIKNNQTNPDPKVKVQGPYKEYGVDLVPDPHALSCPLNAAGAHSCALELATFVYDRDGTLLISTSNGIRATLSAEDYDKLLGTPDKPGPGMAFHQEVSVPVKGYYYLRTAIHDLNSDRVGAVEVPVAAVAHLQPLAAPTASGTPSPATAVAPSAEPVAPAAAPK
jgi:VWFA-related protein